jgi:hypothetical protein
MNEDKRNNWPLLIGNMLIWMNFVTCAWELKKTIFEKEAKQQYQLQSSKLKIGGFENKNSKITFSEDKEKFTFTYEPCERLGKEK